MAKPGFISFQIDTSQWDSTAKQLMNARRMSQPRFLRWRAGIMVKDLTAWTPPRGKHPGSETWAQMKKRGMMAVASDLGRLFWKLSSFTPLALGQDKSALKEWKQAMSSGAVQTIRTIMDKIDVKSRGVTLGPDEASHKSARREGRVPKRFNPPYHILRAGLLAAYTRGVQNRVGEWKHGWMRAISHLGIKGIPEWVKNQKSNPGVIIDHSQDKNEPFIQVENHAAGTAQGSIGNIVGSAIRINEVKMNIELEKHLGALFARASAK